MAFVRVGLIIAALVLGWTAVRAHPAVMPTLTVQVAP